MVIERGQHSPSRGMVEDNANEAILEKQYYYINHCCITPNFIYLDVACYHGCRDVIIRRSDNTVIHNRYYSYEKDDGSQHLRLKELDGNGTFWPWISHKEKVAGLVDNRDKSKNPILVVATERHADGKAEQQ